MVPTPKDSEKNALPSASMSKSPESTFSKSGSR